MVGRIVASINIGVLILRTCEHGIFHGKRNFAGAIKLRMFRWGNYPGSSGWVKCNKKIVFLRERAKQENLKT